ncbi:Spy/CpxP family protein refolding chaperone [Brachyspira alvinipulli]|uniref:Spy/CpxP family protein refolding chaperone n=1 Tax=Brachyspira alvinipulli TaxID=84379 RepID=UPI0004B8D682|nr:periplasmic heavy metal sensor [Brachyspira alvinipulli]
MFNKKIILIAAIMVLSSISLFARGYEKKFDYCERGFYGKRFPNVQLTVEQISQIQDIENKYYSKIQDLRLDIHNQIQTIRLEMAKETPDQNIINKAIDSKTQSSAELQKIRIQRFLEIDKVYKTK